MKPHNIDTCVQMEPYNPDIATMKIPDKSYINKSELKIWFYNKIHDQIKCKLQRDEQ